MFTQTFGASSEYMFQAMSEGVYQPPVTSLASLVLVAPSFAVASRRLHDIGQSGWLAIACVIPLVALVIGFPEGKKGANQHGPNPLESAG